MDKLVCFKHTFSAEKTPTSSKITYVDRSQYHFMRKSRRKEKYKKYMKDFPLRFFRNYFMARGCMRVQWSDVLWSCSLKLSAASDFLSSICFKCFAGLQSTCTELFWPFYPSNILNIWPAFLPAVLLPRILLK